MEDRIDELDNAENLADLRRDERVQSVRRQRVEERLERQPSEKKFNKLKRLMTLKLSATTECPICICDFDKGEKVARLPCHASHLYHQDCLDLYIETQKNKNKDLACSLCRRKFNENNVTKMEYKGLETPLPKLAADTDVSRPSEIAMIQKVNRADDVEGAEIEEVVPAPVSVRVYENAEEEVEIVVEQPVVNMSARQAINLQEEVVVEEEGEAEQEEIMPAEFVPPPVAEDAYDDNDEGVEAAVVEPAEVQVAIQHEEEEDESQHSVNLSAAAEPDHVEVDN